MGKYEKTKKLLITGLTFGVLCSGTSFIVPAEKVAADASTNGTIFKATFGNIYEKFLKQPFIKFLEESAARNNYTSDLENIGYKAPTFERGQFAISVFDYYKNPNFSKKNSSLYIPGELV